MLPNTKRNEHRLAAFSDISRNSIRSWSRWICAHKVHSETRRKNAIHFWLGAPWALALCVFGESVFASIPDHEVRAAKLTNRWISVRRTLGGYEIRFTLCVDQVAENRLENSRAIVRQRHVARSGVLMVKWTWECLCRWYQQDSRHFRHDTTTKKSRCVEEVSTQKHLGSEHYGLNSAKILGCLSCETPCPGKSHSSRNLGGVSTDSNCGGGETWNRS